VISAEQALSGAKRDLQQQRGHLAALQQGKQDHDDDAWMRSGEPQPGDKCAVPLSIALRTCPLAQQYNVLDFTSAQALQSVEKQIPLWATQVSAMERSVQEQEAAVRTLRTSLTSAEAKRLAARDRLREAERTSIEQEERLRALRRQTTQLQESEELRRKTVSRLEAIRREIRISADQLDALRKRLKDRLSDLSALFQDILQAVLGQEVTAAIEPYAEEIRLTVSYHGSRTSAATETIKILAFDIACMLLSVEGHGGHPRFLVHDSPREADMSRDIYHRFFLYMKELEGRYTGGLSPSFQYIITTTEQPPEGLSSAPWLVAALDASTPKGRLLGVDL
jgi:DNA repair exonuclease SbcCD ATPase subunit